MIPKKVKIVEVGPRDGLQNESQFISTQVKIDFINKLFESGLEDVELTSLVKAENIPQLKDAELVFKSISDNKNINLNKCPILVPNTKGMERALHLGVERVALFTATSEKFNQKNINSSIEESLERLEAVAKICQREKVTIRGYVSTVFGCPYEGKKTSGNLESIIKRLIDMGADEISLGDTIGVATPYHVEEVLSSVLKYCPQEKIAMHFHDTYSRALANVYASLKFGISIFDSSAGGMGGCPYAKGASGNLATEDLVSLLNEMGIAHGVDLNRVIESSAGIFTELGRKSMSKVNQVYRNAI